jgi:hypothetical protein
METLVTAGWVVPLNEDKQPGQPCRKWWVEPRVHEVFAEQAQAERQRREQERTRIDEATKRLATIKQPCGKIE